MHEALGTLRLGGTLRFSIGPFNTEEDIDAAIVALREIAASL
jgi:cysteine sulfinate desulfinase/cysteine desulfurase-like protein